MASEALLPQIDEAAARFLDVVGDAPPSLWAEKPPHGPWSLSEIVEHVAIANGFVADVLSRLEPLGAPPDVIDDEMPYLFYDGEEPPGVGAPSGTWTDATRAIATFERRIGRIRDLVSTTPLDLRANGLRHPAFGVLDGVQWVRFAAVHMWRHRSQAIKTRRALDG